ncbi:site-specific integrase, partial [Lactobacillus crispatus]
NWIGSHSMRKTGAFMVYQQTNHNTALVMKMLNHSSEAMTLRYLGLEQERREALLDQVNFNLL